MNDIEKKYIFASLFVIANRLQVLGDKLDPNLTVKQWLLIACISKCSTAPTISKVANTIGKSRQNVKKMAVILKREGFLDLKKDSKDARTLRICLTDKCQKYFKKREGKESEFIERLFEGFDRVATDMDGSTREAEWSAIVNEYHKVNGILQPKVVQSICIIQKETAFILMKINLVYLLN